MRASYLLALRMLLTVSAAMLVIMPYSPAAQANPDAGAEGAAWAAAYDAPPRYPNVHIDWDVPITMSDGTVLKANIYRPADASGAPVVEPTPTILNLTPYTKLVWNVLDSALAVPVLGDAILQLFRDFDLTGTPFDGVTDITKAWGTGLPRNLTVDRNLIRSGYTQVVIDVRGTGFSQGVMEFFGAREQQDSIEAIDWITKQPWSTGDIGMSGVSYSAVNQIQAADKQPAALKAIFPVVPGSDLLRDILAPGGALQIGFVPAWLVGVNVTKLLPDLLSAVQGRFDWKWLVDRVSSPMTFFDMLFAALTVPDIDQLPDSVRALFNEHSPLRDGMLSHPERIRTPAFVVGGWHDVFANTEPFIYQQIQLPPGQKQLLMDNAYHINVGADFGEQGFPPRLDVLQRAWFDKWLKGIDNGVDNYGPITSKQIGGGWTSTDQFPRAGVEYQRMYLSPAPSGTTATSVHDGSLTTATEFAPERLTVAPGVTSICSNDTAVVTAGAASILSGCAKDARPHELNGLTFTSAPVDEPTLISGPVNVHLNTVLDAVDGYWTATINDVGPDGRSTVLATGQLTASLRAIDPERSVRSPNGDLTAPYPQLTLTGRQPILPGVPTALDLGLTPTDAVLQPGHRLRVDVFASNLPKGLPLLPMLVDSQLAPQHLQLDPNEPSFANVPVGGRPTW
ncbi:CocE/NonD family hydrolase [Nocardia sp. NPDC051321]|uniref:CocE/NonD family hydrolase n=1 Tax=Nocardia sp. NPDC051321 TaxID=3364323 RepID=UPI0037B13622